MTNDELEQYIYSRTRQFVGTHVLEVINELLSASIADTAGAKPVAWMWNERASEFNDYQGRLRFTTERPKNSQAPLGMTPLYAAPPAPSVADTAGAKPVAYVCKLVDSETGLDWRIDPESLPLGTELYLAAPPAPSVAAPTAKSMRCPRGGGSCAVESCVEEGACTMQRVTESAPSVADAATKS